jgi:hypothetical protein
MKISDLRKGLKVRGLDMCMGYSAVVPEEWASAVCVGVGSKSVGWECDWLQCIGINLAKVYLLRAREEKEEER